jgi:hypothetical protein
MHPGGVWGDPRKKRALFPRNGYAAFDASVQFEIPALLTAEVRCACGRSCGGFGSPRMPPL